MKQVGAADNFEPALMVLLGAFSDALLGSREIGAAGLASMIEAHNGGRQDLSPTRVTGCKQLGRALEHVPAAFAPVREAVRNLDPMVQWREAPHHAIPEGSWWDHAYAELIGPDGHFASSTLRFGMYVQAPEMAYVAHAHGAEEFYMVLSGVADWEADGLRTANVGPGAIRHHPPNVPHATFTGPEPLLALWGWRGDIAFESYRFV